MCVCRVCVCLSVEYSRERHLPLLLQILLTKRFWQMSHVQVWEPKIGGFRNSKPVMSDQKKEQKRDKNEKIRFWNQKLAVSGIVNLYWVI